MQKTRGYSLVEILVTLAVTSLVLAGLVSTFTTVSQGINNTTKKSSQTNTLRGLSEMMRKDFAAAGQGVSDLNAYNIRYVLSSGFTGINNDDGSADRPRYFYGVHDVDFEPVSGKDFSSVTLQWFDYKYASGADRPTFFVSDYQWEDSGTYVGPLVLSTSDPDHIDDLQSGDIMVFYKLRVMYDQDAYAADAGPAIWNAGHETDGFPDNEAIILQIDSITQGASGGFDDLDYKVQITFKSDGLFYNNFPDPEERMQTRIPVQSGNLADKIDKGHPPPQSFIARKLGDEESYRRVVYSIRKMDSSNNYVLIRSSNVGTTSYEELVATNVSDFRVRLGLDLAVGIEPGLVQRSDVDGYVTLTDNTAWTMSYTYNPGLPPWPTSDIDLDDFRTVIGRHTLTADVLFTQKADDKLDSSVVRTFRQQFRVLNNTLPMPSS